MQYSIIFKLVRSHLRGIRFPVFKKMMGQFCNLMRFRGLQAAASGADQTFLTFIFRKELRRIGVIWILLFATLAVASPPIMKWDWAGSQYGLSFYLLTVKSCADESSILQIKVENKRENGVKVKFRVWNSSFDESAILHLEAGAIDSSFSIQPHTSTCYPAIDNIWVESWDGAVTLAEGLSSRIFGKETPTDSIDLTSSDTEVLMDFSP